MAALDFGVVGHRRWPRIKSQWISYLPFAETASTLLGGDTIHDVVTTAGIRLPEAGETIEIEDVPNIRSALFSEAAYDTFSALATISAAERAVARGSTTIGVALGYYALLFATRAWLSLLGLARVEVASKFYVIDVWPHLGKLTAQGRPVVWSPVLAVTKSERFEHDFHWRMSVFVAQRTYSFGAEVPFVDLIKRFGDNHSFSRRRNGFLYRRQWKYSDMFVDVIDEGVGLLRSIQKVEFDEFDLDLKIGQLACGAVFEALLDIASQSANTKNICSELKSYVTAERHPLMFRGELLPVLSRLSG